MSYRICCWTLFDITSTGVLNRNRPSDTINEEWLLKRNTQCNFDTVLQVISLRSQPEIVKMPERIKFSEIDYTKFGFQYEITDTDYFWKFEFEVHHSSVFENGIIPLGALYSDCNGVPMIIVGTQSIITPPLLETSVELKNIYFEEI